LVTARTAVLGEMQVLPTNGGPRELRRQGRRFLPPLILTCIWLLTGCGGSSQTVVTPSVPVVTSILPANGSASGGTTVTVNGAHFAFTTPVLVYFGGTQANDTTLKVLSDVRLTIVAPPGSGTVDVTVQTGVGTSAIVASDKFTYTGPNNYVFRSTFGSYGSGNGQFTNPGGIATDSAGNIYVTDSNATAQGATSFYARVEKFDSQGNYLSQFGSYGTGNGQFINPGGITVDHNGNIYVMDNGSANAAQARVQKFDSQGNYLLQFGTYGTGNGQFTSTGSIPDGIAVDPNGNVYVTDNSGSTSIFGGPRVEKFDSQGNFLLQFGSYGSGDGAFNLVYGVATDSAGNVYVADNGYGLPGPTYNHRVEMFDSQGNYLSQFGAAQFIGPKFVAVDSSGSVFASDYTQVIFKFNAGGTLLTQIGSNGAGNGQFSGISGIALGAGGDLNVLDTGSVNSATYRRVEIFQPSP